MTTKKQAPIKSPKSLAFDLEQTKKSFAKLCQVIAQLRDPEHGCPWDLKQTHESLRTYMLEEAYEASAAMGANDKTQMCDELGDVLLQVVLNAQLAVDAGTFSINDVIEGLTAKMIRRHPHIFGDGQAKTSEDVLTRWDEIKREEKGLGKEAKESLLSDLPSMDHYPSTHFAYKIGKRSAKYNFDWPNAGEVFENFLSEVKETQEEWEGQSVNRLARLKDELGDVYFSLAQFCRHLKLDPEVVAQDGNRKFVRRFELVEELAKKDGVVLTELSIDAMQQLWIRAKKLDTVSPS